MNQVGAAANALAGNVKAGVDNINAGVKETVAFFDWLSTPYAWERIALVLGGLATIVLGLGLFGLSFVSQEDVAKVAKVAAVA
jgi:hypothetical protein